MPRTVGKRSAEAVALGAGHAYTRTVDSCASATKRECWPAWSTALFCTITDPLSQYARCEFCLQDLGARRRRSSRPRADLKVSKVASHRDLPDAAPPTRSGPRRPPSACAERLLKINPKSGRRTRSTAPFCTMTGPSSFSASSDTPPSSRPRTLVVCGHAYGHACGHGCGRLFGDVCGHV